MQLLKKSEYFLSMYVHLIHSTAQSNMTINDFALACSLDQSPPYFTYSGQTMLIIQSKFHSMSNTDGFEYVEPFMEALVSHESIHVIIKKIECGEVSDSLDDIEVIVEQRGMRFQVTLNNMLFAKDNCGIVFPWD